MIQSLPKSLSSEPCIEIQVTSYLNHRQCKIENSGKQIFKDVRGLEHLGQYEY